MSNSLDRGSVRSFLNRRSASGQSQSLAVARSRRARMRQNWAR